MRLSALRPRAATKDWVTQQLYKYGSFRPTPLSLGKLLEFGREQSQVKSFRFLRQEVPVRLANIMQEIYLLPEKLLSQPSTQVVVDNYRRSFANVIQFSDKASELSDSRLSDFTETVAEMLERHRHVVPTMAEGVREMKEAVEVTPQLDSQVQYFLDRFYLCRISIRMLLNQHVLLFGPELRSDWRQIGCIDPHCNIPAVIDHAYSSARFLCEQRYLTAPRLETKLVGLDNRTDFVCVPSHLYHMLFEVIKNSMRATVEKDEENLAPIRVVVSLGREDVTIKVSDLGGGIRRSALPHVFRYTYTTASLGQHSGGNAPLAGYGYGLPLSRVYARYLHGDLRLCSADGHGTDAYVFLKRNSSEAKELLPVFNRNAASHYTFHQPVHDWSDAVR